MNLYTWANRASIPQQFIIDNLDPATYPGAGTLDAYRDYTAGMFVLERRLANRWQARISYVLSKTEGNVTSGTFTGVNSSLFENPNTSLTNREGRVPLDRPHEIKVFAGYQIPKIEVAVNGYFRSVSGQTYTPFSRQTAGRVNWTGSVDVNLEPQCTDRIDALNVLDVRLEKVFSVDVHRFGLYADIENVFNASPILTRNARFPSAAIAGNTVLYGGATAVNAARQATIGVRWSF